MARRTVIPGSERAEMERVEKENAEEEDEEEKAWVLEQCILLFQKQALLLCHGGSEGERMESSSRLRAL